MESFSIGRVLSRSFSLVIETLASVGVFVLVLQIVGGGAQFAMQGVMMGDMMSAQTPGDPAAALAMFGSVWYWGMLVFSVALSSLSFAGAIGGMLKAANGEAISIGDCFTVGAIDYVTWPIAGKDLAATLDRALDRAERMGNTKLREVMARARIEKLTRREREVLSGVASGLSNRLIGQRLAISPRTVEIHRANMLNKLGANHTSEAIRIAIEADLA